MFFETAVSHDLCWAGILQAFSHLIFHEVSAPFYRSKKQEIQTQIALPGFKAMSKLTVLCFKLLGPLTFPQYFKVECIINNSLPDMC